ASEHHGAHRVPHVQRRPPTAIRRPSGRRLSDTGPAGVQPHRSAWHRADGLSGHFSVPRLQVRPEANDQGRRARLDVRPPGRLLEARSLDVEKLGESSFLVRLVLQNSGWLPTNVTEKALERKAVRDLEVELELPEGARLVGGDVKTEAGQLRGRADKRSTTWWANDESTRDLVKLEWVVEAAAGTEIGNEARHARAGTVRRTITLE